MLSQEVMASSHLLAGDDGEWSQVDVCVCDPYLPLGEVGLTGEVLPLLSVPWHNPQLPSGLSFWAFGTKAQCLSCRTLLGENTACLTSHSVPKCRPLAGFTPWKPSGQSKVESEYHSWAWGSAQSCLQV